MHYHHVPRLQHTPLDKFLGYHSDMLDFFVSEQAVFVLVPGRF
jgi:hypothetical protein